MNTHSGEGRKSFTFEQNKRSRSIRITVHVRPEWVFTLPQNMHYQRVPRLQEELRIRHGSGTFGKWLIQLAKTDVLVLVLDDWGMGAVDSKTRSDLLEIIDDRASHKATIIPDFPLGFFKA